MNLEINQNFNIACNKEKYTKNNTPITLKNRFIPTKMSKSTPAKNTKKIPENLSPKKLQITEIVHNLSKVSLTPTEINLLEKGLNFCPTTTEPDNETLLNDIYFFFVAN